MYAKELRPTPRGQRPTPPRNYSGTAFPENITSAPAPPPTLTSSDGTDATILRTAPLLPPPPEAEPQQQSTVGQEKAAETAEAGETGEAVEAAATPVPPPRHKPPRGFLSSLIPPGFSDTGDSDPGFEELLLVGLIFLLSRGEQDSDILLMLALLLLYR